MKTFSIILSLIFLHISSSIFATDIYVNSSGQSGTYTTIGAAITAASSGDRIFISPYGTYTENLSIDKSLTLTSSASGTNFNVIGNITIAADAGNEVRIIGCIFSGTILSSQGTASQNNMSNVYIIDSEGYNIANAGDFVKTHVLFCNNLQYVSISHGEIIGCKIFGNVTINDGPNAGTGDTLKIIGNLISGTLTYNSDDDLFYISNNFFKLPDNSPTATRQSVRIMNSFYSTSANNVFNNNTCIYFSGQNNNVYRGVEVTSSSNQSNIIVTNNVFEDMQTANYGNSGNKISFYTSATTAAQKPQASYNVAFGYAYWTSVISNSVLIHTSGPSNFNYDDYGRSVDPRIVNSGSPSIQHYDIDMTINDLGTYGGPHSIDNYINTTNGKARIFDLNMPFEIWTGQTPTITAKGVHTK